MNVEVFLAILCNTKHTTELQTNDFERILWPPQKKMTDPTYATDILHKVSNVKITELDY